MIDFRLVEYSRCYNKVNNKYCFFCCWGNRNNVFYNAYYNIVLRWFR